LVNQVYFRLAAAKDRDWQGSEDFFAVAARAMRWHMIDCARKRRKVQFVALEQVSSVVAHNFSDLDLLTCIRHLMDQLTHINPTWRLIVELKYYLGLTDRETAQRMGIKLRTMQRTWTAAKHWLYERAGDSRQQECTLKVLAPASKGSSSAGDRDTEESVIRSSQAAGLRAADNSSAISEKLTPAFLCHGSSHRRLVAQRLQPTPVALHPHSCYMQRISAVGLMSEINHGKLSG
jgi:RNA polymerase sigma factor (sigma-70 family)